MQQLTLIVAVIPSALIWDHTALSAEVAWEVAVLPFLSPFFLLQEQDDLTIIWQ